MKGLFVKGRYAWESSRQRGRRTTRQAGAAHALVTQRDAATHHTRLVSQSNHTQTHHKAPDDATLEQINA